MLESKIQAKILKDLEKDFIPIKIIKINKNWYPDILILIGDWRHIWIEVKQKKWKESAIQVFRRKQLTEYWDHAFVVHSYEEYLQIKPFISQYASKI
jgi:hypothetical protein